MSRDNYRIKRWSGMGFATASLDPLAPGAPGALTNQSATTDVTPTIRIALNTAGGVLSNIATDVMTLYANGASVGTRTLDATDISNGYCQITCTAEQRNTSTAFTAKSAHGAHVSPSSATLTVTFDWDDTIAYGQSYTGGFMTDSASPGTPLEGTSVYNITTNLWAAPTGNGAIAYLNARKTATGRPQRIVYAFQNGVASSSLLQGTSNFTDLTSRIAASGANPVRALIYQGAGNAAGGGTGGAAFKADWAAIHASLTSALGLSSTALPFIFSGLPSTADATITDANWQAISAAIITGESDYSWWYFSHSPKASPLVDSYHPTPAEMAVAGGLYCQTTRFVDGAVATRPRFFLTGITRDDATHTTFTLVHSMGTDFTPTSAFTGIEISGDNGANYVTPSAIARVTATTFQATHSNLGTSQRFARYGYGKAIITTPVLDNGTLTAPLVITSTDLVAAGAATLPVPTFQSAAGMVLNTTYERTAISIGSATASNKLVVLAQTSSGGNITDNTMTVTPTGGGTPVSATRHVTATITQPNVRIYSAVVPGSTTSIDVTTNGTGNARNLAVWTIPVDDLSSTTPVGTGTNTGTASTAVSCTLPTTSGGCVIAAQASSGFPTITINGTETYAMRYLVSGGGGSNRGADASGVATNASSTVTSNTDTSQTHAVAAASWR